MYFLNVCLKLLVVLVSIIVLVISRIKWCQQYWKRKGLPYLEPSFPFGNVGNPFNRKQHLGIIIQSMYNKLKQMDAKHGGLYSFANPVYLPIDLDILKDVMQKDFNYFQDRGFYYNEKDDPISAHLFALSGPKWRHLRTKLTPTFTSGKMKMMLHILVQCAENMQRAMQKYENYDEGIDIKDTLARYTTDVIGSCAFGLECNSFKDEHCEFRKYGKNIFKRFSKFEGLLHALAFYKPNLARKFGYKLFSSDISTFFIKVVKETIKYREDNKVKRNDMLQLLMDLKIDVLDDPERTNKHNDKALSLNEIAAQAFVFFIAGFETSSTTMTFCLYELAINADVQEKVRNEIKNVLDKHGGKITYEAILNMEYMGQVIDETLRKYPPLAFVTRRCVQDYQITGTDKTIDKGTMVFIPILALHHDSEYFPNPEEFDPERFSKINKSKVRSFSYIPFGEGPRICIGMRFGMMQTKVGLTILLKNYIISLNKKTVVPINIDRHSFILAAKEGVWLDIKKVSWTK